MTEGERGRAQPSEAAIKAASAITTISDEHIRAIGCALYAVDGLAPLSKEQQLTQGDLAAVLHDVLERELGEVMWHPTMEDVAAAVLVRFGGLRVGQTPEREGKS